MSARPLERSQQTIVERCVASPAASIGRPATAGDSQASTHGALERGSEFQRVLLDETVHAELGRDRHVRRGDFAAAVVEYHGAAAVPALVQRQDESRRGPGRHWRWLSS